MGPWDVELSWESPTVANIPLPPSRDEAEHRRYLRFLQLHLALLDGGSPALSTVALSAALDHAAAGAADQSWGWLTAVELSVSLTSWFPAPWTPESLARTLSRHHRDAPAPTRWAAWAWLGDPSFSAMPGADGSWTVVRSERGNEETARLPGDRALVVLWMDHFRDKYGFPLAHAVDPADVAELAPASLAVISADAADAAFAYRASWRDQRDEALAAARDAQRLARPD
ncbi:hypothetical protein [Microlunatus endophyticus]|nr:hypothetical protein [Microlunatus endophyticus]